jgi:cell division protein DivIC
MVRAMVVKKKKKKKKKKRILWVLIFLFIGGFFLREQYMMYNLNKVKSVYNERLSNIKLQNEQLQNEIKLAKRKDYVENQAREKLGLVKPNEILFIDKNKKK